MKQQPKDCFEAIVNPYDADARLQTAAEVYSRQASYWSFHNWVREQDRDSADFCAPLPRQVAEKAVDTERSLRVLLKDAMDSLNEVVDSRRMETSIQRAVDFFAKYDRSQFQDGIRLAQEALMERYPDQDFSFIDRALELLEEHDVQLKTEKDGILVEAKTQQGEFGRFVIEPKPLPGQFGRISTRQFFVSETSGASETQVASFLPVFVLPDCHHRQQVVKVDQAEVHVLDVYGSLVNSFTIAKESIYRHVRKVDEIGLTYYEGDDPITAILVAIGIVAAALVIAGAVIEIGCTTDWWSGDVCDWGWGLLFAGVVLGGVVCVASGACELVVTLFVQIVV